MPVHKYYQNIVFHEKEGAKTFAMQDMHKLINKWWSRNTDARTCTSTPSAMTSKLGSLLSKNKKYEEKLWLPQHH
jgi:hypothetical protein